MASWVISSMGRAPKAAGGVVKLGSPSAATCAAIFVVFSTGEPALPGRARVRRCGAPTAGASRCRGLGVVT